MEIVAIFLIWAYHPSPLTVAATPKKTEKPQPHRGQGRRIKLLIVVDAIA